MEFFYSDKLLRSADGSPYADIVRSIQQSLYSGEYKDTTGLAQRQEVNNESGSRGLQFFRTSRGKVYGFVKDGKIYLDPRIATSESAVHEYSHLWSEALEKANPRRAPRWSD